MQKERIFMNRISTMYPQIRSSIKPSAAGKPGKALLFVNVIGIFLSFSIFYNNPCSSHVRTCRIPSLGGRQKSSSETTSFS